MKKNAYVIIVLIFTFSIFLSSMVFAFDSYIEPTSEKDELYWDSVMSFFDEYLVVTFEDPENPEGPGDNIGPKNEESELNRRGHRIRIPVAEKKEKKFIEIDY
ncbi:hypothetical protein K9M79_07480 [Candidatus Woesearchaeota archaeon]|nr:hypothetical protein [Candidatus Woesearchaeota archaeon]